MHGHAAAVTVCRRCHCKGVGTHAVDAHTPIVHVNGLPPRDGIMATRSHASKLLLCHTAMAAA